MKRVWKASGILILVILVLSYIGNIVKVNEQETYFKQELLQLIAGANSILTIIIEEDPEVKENKWDDNDYRVDLNLSIEEIHGSMWNLEYEFE